MNEIIYLEKKGKIKNKNKTKTDVNEYQVLDNNK